MPRRDKEKNRQYQAKWYNLNKKVHIVRAKATTKRKKEWLKSLKIGKSCIKCGQSHPAALDYHHRDPNKKDFNLSLAYNWAKHKILAEIEKCDIICASCHRILHWELRNNIDTNNIQ